MQGSCVEEQFVLPGVLAVGLWPSSCSEIFQFGCRCSRRWGCVQGSCLIGLLVKQHSRAAPKDGAMKTSVWF